MRTKLLAAFLFMLPALVAAQTPSTLSQNEVEDIIRKFSTKEKAFKLARENYTYRQTIQIEDRGSSGDRVVGRYELTEDVLFSAQGKRIEKVVYAPMTSLQNFSMSPEDERDLRDIQPFVLTSDDIGKYNLRYLGKQKIDEIDCFLFWVEPKTIEKNQRYFQGQIWVDDRDFQIVKTFGKAVPDLNKGKSNENIFPRFETYREQIDGKFWFPTYTRADDTLNFKSGPIHIREVVKYEDYKQFRSTATITFGGEVTDTKKPDDKKPDQKPN